MNTFHASFNEDNKEFHTSFNEDSKEFHADFGEFSIRKDRVSYDDLEDKPKINSVELIGDLTAEDLKIVLRDSTKNWNAQTSLIAEKNVIYIYTDYYVEDNGDGTYTYIPGIKIGDGTSYLIDMPFVAADNPIIQKHIMDNTIHVTAEEKEFWNRKWRGYMNPNIEETLFFTIN